MNKTDLENYVEEHGINIASLEEMEEEGGELFLVEPTDE